MRNLDMFGISERELYAKVRKYFVDTYKLTEDKEKNKQKLAEFGGYRFDSELLGTTLSGVFIETESLTKDNVGYHITTRTVIDTHKHGIYLLHVIDSIKGYLGAQTNTVKVILERLFRSRGDNKHKLLALGTSDFYAFIINNEEKLRRDVRELAAEISDEQSKLSLYIKTAPFNIPEEDFFKYDANGKQEIEYLSNAYKLYTSGYATSVVRSTCEMLFERYCEEHRENIDWVYKNGDSGQQYFSIVYYTNFRQRLFYPDYIVKKKDGSVWLIECKGGESHGQSKNVDKHAPQKFEAMKSYVEGKEISWAFIRDEDSLLYYNNIEYTEHLGEKWRSIKEIID